MKGILIRLASVLSVLIITVKILNAYGPKLLNRYTESTAALFPYHAKLILLGDLGYPREIVLKINPEKLSLDQLSVLVNKGYVNSGRQWIQIPPGSQSQDLLSEQSIFLGYQIPELTDRPTPERSYNGRLLCQVFFASVWEKSDSSNIWMTDPDLRNIALSMIPNLEFSGQVTMEKNGWSWNIQDASAVSIQLAGQPSKRYGLIKTIL